MKKAAVLLTTLAVLAFFTAAAAAEKAPPPVTPGDGLYTAVSALEHAQLQTSEGLPEQALYQNEFANRRMNALEALEMADPNAEGFGAEVIDKLMEDLNDNEKNLGLIIAGMAKDKEVPAAAAVLEGIAGEIDERGWRLGQIADDEGMPEGAREGAKKALQNMEANAHQAAWALGARGEAGEAGPPPWAGNGQEEENGVSQDEAQDAAPPEGAPPVEVPPVGEPPAGPPVDGLPKAPPEDK